MFSQKESNDDDFVIVEFPYSLSPYLPSQLNKILQGWVKDKKEVKREAAFCAGWILSKKPSSRKIALFNVANYPSSSGITNNGSPTLDEALSVYCKKKISCDKLIIPIAELNRRHFRLLVIEPEKKQALFYDSKARWFAMAAEMLSAGSRDEYYYIEKTCEKYFPGISCAAIYFGDQAWNNHEDCGPYTAEYAFHEIIPGFIHRADQARVNHELFYAKGGNDAKHTSTSKVKMPQKLPLQRMYFSQKRLPSPPLVELDDDWVEVPKP